MEPQEETFTRGEVVEVSDDLIHWEKCIFIAKIELQKYGEIITVLRTYEEEFKNGKEFDTIIFKYARKIKIIELFGNKCSTNQLQEAIKDLKPIE